MSKVVSGLDFGTNNDLNFDLISELTEREIYRRVRELGGDFEVRDIRQFEQLLGKGYTARGQAEISYKGRPLGNGTLYTVLFSLDDGTGNRGDFQIHNVKSEWTPRIKADYAEVFMAIGTGYQGRWFPGMTSLTEITTGDIRGPRIWALPEELNTRGIDFYNFLTQFDESNHLQDDRKHFDFTLHKGNSNGHDDNGYGNPHAIAFVRQSPLVQENPEDPLFQVGAFLGFSEPSEDLGKIEDFVWQGLKIS